MPCCAPICMKTVRQEVGGRFHAASRCLSRAPRMQEPQTRPLWGVLNWWTPGAALPLRTRDSRDSEQSLTKRSPRKEMHRPRLSPQQRPRQNWGGGDANRTQTVCVWSPVASALASSLLRGHAKTRSRVAPPSSKQRGHQNGKSGLRAPAPWWRGQATAGRGLEARHLPAESRHACAQRTPPQAPHTESGLPLPVRPRTTRRGEAAAPARPLHGRRVPEAVRRGAAGPRALHACCPDRRAPES